MHLQPGGRQGHIPDMSWLNKAIYQHGVDTAELGTESQRALAPGPRNTQRAWGALGTGKSVPCFGPLAGDLRALLCPQQGDHARPTPTKGCSGNYSQRDGVQLVSLAEGSPQPGQSPGVL